MMIKQRHEFHSAPNARAVVAMRSALFVGAALAFCAALVFLPCSISLLLGSWFALFFRPWMKKLTKRLHGRTKAAALITTLMVLAIVVPIALSIVPLAQSAADLATNVSKSQQWNDAAQSIVGDGQPTNIVKLARDHMASAWGAVSVVLSTSAIALFGLAMFVVSFFTFVKDGENVVGWLRSHSPLKEAHFDRLAAAYSETGRGLIVGVGATALIQGALATITYAIVGIPRALPLGLMTTVGALIPGVGTVLFWGPITVILALGGYPAKAAIVGLSGALVIGSVDNFVKPLLSTRAQLRLPATLVFISMLSGLAAFGPSGLLLGPLFVRVGMEALDILRDEHLIGQSPRVDLSLLSTSPESHETPSETGIRAANDRP